jgi:hypothetical protein
MFANNDNNNNSGKRGRALSDENAGGSSPLKVPNNSSGNQLSFIAPKGAINF